LQRPGSKIRFEPVITGNLIAEIRSRLSDGRRVRKTLPGNGRLYIDRKLPFLCIYRRPLSGRDEGTDQLVKGEASYLIASPTAKNRGSIASLVRAVVETLSEVPGAFLIIEIWTRESPLTIISPEQGRAAPSFRIFVPPDRIPDKTVESLKKALTRIIISKNKGRVSTVYKNHPWPASLPPLLTLKEILKHNCFLIGLEISPIYRDPENGEIYPLVLKKMQRGLSVAFKKSAFEFSHNRTTLRPSHYKSLGGRAVVKAVWEVDQKMAEISNEFDFLLLVTPVNIEQSYSRFRSCRCDCEPVFYYRPITVDPSVLKRRLYDIPFDRLEDPTLSSIFHEKLVELEKKFSMLRDRNTRNFFYGSMQLFGEINNGLLETAKSILDKIPSQSHEFAGTRKISANAFAERARQEIERYREICPGITNKVFIRDDITGLMVSRGNLFIGDKVSIAESRVEALIQHEVGTHVLTYINGKNQPFQQLYCGLAGCDELQEGLAVLSEYLVGGLSPPRFRLLAGRVLAAHLLIEGATFLDTFRELNSRYGFSIRTAYIVTSRIYRSGGFTKDAVYLRGFMNLLMYLRNGGDLSPLLVGKISIEDIPLITELQLRGILKPSLLAPKYLSSEDAMLRLDDVKKGSLIFDLI
jgi:uncharacterized protein (TIGR02421 family)